MISDSARLAAIRADHAAIAPGRWMLASDAEGEFVEAWGPMGELLPVARIHPGATADEKRFLAAAPEAVGFLLGLVERAIIFASRAQGAHGRAAAGAQDAGLAQSPLPPSADETANNYSKNYSAQAAMLCAEPAFKAFLEQEHGLERPLTDERCAGKLRTLCGVTSRRAFNDDAAAAGRWLALEKAFRDWKKRGRG